MILMGRCWPSAGGSPFRSQWDSATAACLIGDLTFAACCAYRFSKAIPWKWIVVCALTLHASVISFRLYLRHTQPPLQEGR